MSGSLRYAKQRRGQVLAVFGLGAVAVLLAVGVFTTSAASSTQALTAPTWSIPARAVVTPAISCAAIPTSFQQLDAAPTSITSAAVVGTDGAAYCDVKGWIAPQTQFEVKLPTTSYQGRYLQLGCGGNCGVVSFGIEAADAAALSGNTFAVATDNEGHTSTGGVDVWAAGGEANPLRAQFGYLANHLTAIVAKSLIQTYYGQQPAYSYYVGYSDGGRDAVQEAQRYPGEFNGVVAGAPAIIITYAMESFLWAANKLTDSAGNPVLGTADINNLHNAAVAACDGTDGVVDGQISDPRLCSWDPVAIQCSATLTTNCLTPAQVAAARAMYAGPTTSDGKYLWPGGEAYGSEAAWPSFAGAGKALGGSFTKYMAFPQDRPASYTWSDFKFDLATWEEMNDMSAVYNSNNFNNPDLSAFGAAGGKLMVWQSWQDEAGGPWSVPDWYAQLEDAAGGLSNLQQYARLFMLPAGSHGQAAAGSIYSMALVPGIVNWVEGGQAPNKLDAVQSTGTTVTRTYPVYPFPARANYSGTGDVNDEANWVSLTPSPLPDDHFAWLGDPAHGNGHGQNVVGHGKGKG